MYVSLLRVSWWSEVIPAQPLYTRPVQIRGYYYQWNKEAGRGAGGGAGCRPGEHLLLSSSPPCPPPSANNSTMYPLPHLPLVCVHICASRHRQPVQDTFENSFVNGESLSMGGKEVAWELHKIKHKSATYQESGGHCWGVALPRGNTITPENAKHKEFIPKKICDVCESIAVRKCLWSYYETNDMSFQFGSCEN